MKKSPCGIESCKNIAKSGGLCMTHHRYKLEGRDPLSPKLTPRNATPEEALRFVGWTVVATGCWEWNGTVDRHGYGVLSKLAGPKIGTKLAHRVSYAAFTGPLIPELPIHHKCANRKCVNPAHLEMLTQSENMGEMLLRNYYESRIAALESENLSLRAELQEARTPKGPQLFGE